MDAPSGSTAVVGSGGHHLGDTCGEAKTADRVADRPKADGEDYGAADGAGATNRVAKGVSAGICAGNGPGDGEDGGASYNAANADAADGPSSAASGGDAPSAELRDLIAKWRRELIDFMKDPDAWVSERYGGRQEL